MSFYIARNNVLNKFVVLFFLMFMGLFTFEVKILAQENIPTNVQVAEEVRIAQEEADLKARAQSKMPEDVRMVAEMGRMAKEPAMAKKVGSRDWSKIVGSKECSECHKSEVYTWKETHHATTFNLLPRKKNTKAITKKMGIRSVKRDSACLNCHFTAKIVEGNVKAISGISCESCHGPALNWVKVHGDYGGKKVTKEMETAEHKAERLAKIEAARMIRPENLYRVAENCYQCHTVPNEKLVNVGGHKAGSDFELVSWSQGEVRHNFFHSANKENRQALPERKRLMFIVGRSLHLEYTLRGLAQSTKKAKYAVSMAKRVIAIKKELKAIQALIHLPEIEKMLKVADSVKLKLNNEASLLRAADNIAIEAKTIAKTYTGKDWEALDSIIPKKYKGKALEAPPEGQ